MNGFNLMSFRDPLTKKCSKYIRVRKDVVEQYMKDQNVRDWLKHLESFMGNCEVGDGWLEIPWVYTIQKCQPTRKNIEGYVLIEEIPEIVSDLDGSALPQFHRFNLYGIKNDISVQCSYYPQVKKVIIALRKLAYKQRVGVEKNVEFVT